MKVVFLCHGNLCRSPMAEYIFADLVRKAGKEALYEISSAAVTCEEIGNDVYPPAKRCLAAHGVPCPQRAAHLVTNAEAERSDLILCMDHSNLRRLSSVAPYGVPKAHLLGEYGLGGKEIEDPWYTGNFERVYEEIALCAAELLRQGSGK